MNYQITALLILLLTSTSIMEAAVDKKLIVGPAIEVAPKSSDNRPQISPRIATDEKGTYLVVWQQGQDFYESQTADIFAARVSQDGTLLDAEPLSICKADDSQLRPRVTCYQGTFLVVWQDLRNGKDFDVYGARISATGKILDPDGFLISGGPNNQASPNVTTTKNGFLVIWQDYRSKTHYAIHATKIDPAGKIQKATPLAYKGKSLRGGGMTLTFTGNEWFLFWRPLNTKGNSVARIVEQDGAFKVTEINGKLPNYSGRKGQPASNGTKVLYAGTAVHGRGQEFRPGTALLFNPDSCKILNNPNPPVKQGASGWSTKNMICTLLASPGLNGPVSCAADKDGFLIVARGSIKTKGTHGKKLFAKWIPNSGKCASDIKSWTIAHDGTATGHSPDVAYGKDGVYYVAYATSKDGKSIVVCKKVNTQN